MLYNDVFVEQKKAEGKYNLDSDDLAKEIIDDYEKYVSIWRKKISKQSHLFNGLVVGFVQSGKTMNFCHLINRAIDDGFQLIVILSSNKNDLNMQTTDRIANDIVGYANPQVPQITCFSGNKKKHDFMSFYDPKNGQDVGIRTSSIVNFNINGIHNKNNISINNRKPNIYWLTACDMGNIQDRNVDFDINRGGGNENFDDYFNYDREGCYVVVVKKNTHRLGLLYDFLSASKMVKNHMVKALFIDDECDEITVSGKGKKLGKSSVQIDKLQKLFETFPQDKCHSMYVEYTATPIANVCVNNRSNTKTGFPDDFIKILKKGDSYCGFEAYKQFSDIINKVNPQQSDEVINMVPHSNMQLSRIKADTPILYDALVQFILNCKIFEERKKSGVIGNCSTSMLVHTDMTKLTHTDEKDYIEGVLEVLKDELLNELNDIYSNYNGNYLGYGKWQLIDDIYIKFNEIRNKMKICEAKSYYINPVFYKCSKSNYPYDTKFDLQLCIDLLSYIIKRIPNVSYHSAIQFKNNGNKISVLEVNSDSPCKLPADQNFIAVGGNKLARGLTLNNLSVTYFTRQTGAIDTFTQMARWFGYRIGYFDICRLYVDDYNDINAAAEVERELHNQIKVQNAKKIKPKNMHYVFVENIPKLLSGKQALVEKKFGSHNIIETCNFYLVKGVKTNQKVMEKFFAELKKNGYYPKASGQYGFINVLTKTKANSSRHCYISDVDFNIVCEHLFNKYISVSSKKILDEILIVKEYLKKCKTMSVNILLSGRDSNNSIGKYTSFENGIYKVTGMAYKNKAQIIGTSIIQVESFNDCPEDYVVDYPNPKNLNYDFNQYVKGAVYEDNRSTGYAMNVREFGKINRTKPLIIITPFQISTQANLVNTKGIVFYSLKVLIPEKYQSKNMLII